MSDPARRRRLGVLALVTVAFLAMLGAGTFFWLQGYRVTEVLQGEVYRSRQPTAEELEAAATRFELATVINLRGAYPERAWFAEEAAATEELGIERVDLRFRATDLPARREMRQLIRTLEGGSRPILLHCLNGVHRTGWASGVVRLLAGESLAQARAELSDLPLNLGDGGEDQFPRFFDLYEAWLASDGSEHDAATFRRWALEVYCPAPYNAEMSFVGEAPASIVAPGEWVRVGIHVTNRSDVEWKMSAQPKQGIRLGATILGPFDEFPADPLGEFRRPGRHARDLLRAGMEEGAIPPGGVRIFPLNLQAPLEPGRYLIQFDMVEESVHWFSDLGTDGLMLALEVRG